MAYETGIVASAAALKSAIETFAGAQGWTLAGGVLSKGACYVRLTTPSAAELRIEGARGGTFSGNDLCPRYSRIANTTWPASATYHLAGFSSPDTIWCTINFDALKYQHLGFGTISKYGTWTGGAWFHAQHGEAHADTRICSLVDGGMAPYYGGSAGECALFWAPVSRDSNAQGFVENNVSSLHCELNGNVWEPPRDKNLRLQGPDVISPIHKTNPNAFNGQTLLSPFAIFLAATDGYLQALGHVGHLRFVKLTHYNPGDILELGDDQWKVYPWSVKDLVYPDGKRETFSTGSTISTGVLGVAVRYDGP